MPDVPLVANNVVAAPKDYLVPLAQEIIVKSVRAAIDGSGAAGSYVPALQLIAPNGDVMLTAVDDTTRTAGASVDVTWFPGVKPAVTSSGGSGIQFDTHPQSGDWLEVTTTGSDPNNDGFGIALTDTGGNGIQLATTGRSTDGGGVYVNYDDTTSGFGVDTGIDISAGGSAGATIRGLNSTALGGGTSPAVAINAQAEADASALAADGADVSATIISGTGAANANGVSGSAIVNHLAGATGNAIGVHGNGNNNSSGKAVGGDFYGNQTANGTGDVIALRATVNTVGGSTSTVYGMQVFIGATKVFQINSDGSLHGLTGKSLTFDL